MGHLETPIQQAILTYLQILENQGKLVFIRNNSFAGHIQRRDGSLGFIRNAKIGAPDVFIWLSGGKCLFVEIKAPGGKQSLSQVEFQTKVEKLGHTYLIARSLDDVENCLKRII